MRSSLLFVCGVVAGLGLFPGCRSRPDAPAPAEWHQWRADRRESIAGTNGWSTVVGLQWLHEGTNQVDVPTATGPLVVGILVWTQHSARFEAAPAIRVTQDGQPVTVTGLRSDSGGAVPDVLAVGTVQFFLIERGERLGLRFKDSEASTRREFSGLEYFPYDPRWRLEGWFEPASPPRVINIQDVTGVAKPESCPGRLRFEVGGQEFRLEALFDEETQDYFVLFRDQTAGQTTYGSGRFLHVAREEASGRVVVDFNFAYNPPCAFTEFATCPLPPRLNWLPFAIPAGERQYGRGHASTELRHSKGEDSFGEPGGVPPAPAQTP